MSSYDWFGSMAFYPPGLAVWGPVAAAVPDIRRLAAKPRPVSTARA